MDWSGKIQPGQFSCRNLALRSLRPFAAIPFRNSGSHTVGFNDRRGPNRLGARLGRTLREFPYEPVLNLLPRPRGFAQKLEAGGQAGVEHEAANRNASRHLGPAVPVHQVLHDSRQSDPVQRVARMRCGRRHRHEASEEQPLRQSVRQRETATRARALEEQAGAVRLPVKNSTLTEGRWGIP